MIYLDSAATSFLKPPGVRQAVMQAMNTMSSPGRGAYRNAMRAADTVLECRMALSELFHVPAPESVIFTSNATHALNIAIRSLVKAGERVVISGYEHNAVTRPLYALGAQVDVAAAPLFDKKAQLDAFGRKLRGAKAAVCTHVSNVFGFVLPIEEIAVACRREGVPLIIDASQSAGILPIDFKALGADYIAMPGHKSLLGPQGTGVLLCREIPEPLLYGGTGSNSLAQQMPDFLPDRMEAGTHNVPGIAGLLAGVRWIAQKGTKTIHAHEQMLMRSFISDIAENRRLHLLAADDPSAQGGLLSLQVRDIDSEEVAHRLGKQGIAVRAGLHCAPLAHRSAGTLDSGAVRVSFSPFNTQKEVRRAAAILMNMAR